MSRVHQFDIRVGVQLQIDPPLVGLGSGNSKLLARKAYALAGKSAPHVLNFGREASVSRFCASVSLFCTKCLVMVVKRKQHNRYLAIGIVYIATIISQGMCSGVTLSFWHSGPV